VVARLEIKGAATQDGGQPLARLDSQVQPYVSIGRRAQMGKALGLQGEHDGKSPDLHMLQPLVAFSDLCKIASAARSPANTWYRLAGSHGSLL